MNLNKWKSVLLPREIYEEIKIIAKVEGRTISGQTKIIFADWKENNLSEKDKEYIAAQLIQNKLPNLRVTNHRLFLTILPALCQSSYERNRTRVASSP